MTPELKTLLSDDYDTFRHIVVDSLQLAYSSTLEGHKPAYGHNAQTFGNTVWHSSVHFLLQNFSDKLSSAVVARPDQSLRIQLRDAAFYISKAGYRPDDDIHQFRFDQSAIRARIAAENDRLQLFDYNAIGNVVPPSLPVVWNVMIAHCGNSIDGMCKIAVGPIRSHKKGQSPWIGEPDIIYVKTAGLASVEDVLRADIAPAPIDPWAEKPVAELQIGPKIIIPRVAPSRVEATDAS